MNVKRVWKGPKWSRGKLGEHYRKHGRGVAAALEVEPPPDFIEFVYDFNAKETVRSARFRFEAEKWEKGVQKYPLSGYHLSHLLLQSITDLNKKRVFTFFPLGFGSESLAPEKLPKMTKADRAEKLRRYLNGLEDAMILRKLKRSHGFK